MPATVRNGSLVVAHGRDTGELAKFAAAPSSSNGSTASASARWSPICAGASARRCSFQQEGHLDPRAALARAGCSGSGELGVPIRYGVAGAMPDACLLRRAADVAPHVDCTGLAAREEFSRTFAA